MIFQKSTIFIFFIVLMNTVSSTKKIDKLIDAEIKKVFQNEEFQKVSIEVPNSIEVTLPKDFVSSNFKRIKSKEVNLGYYYYVNAFGKIDYFDFIVIFDNDLMVEKVKILIYREDHGAEIRSKRWLKQFIGKTVEKEVIYSKNIVGISGATLSVKSMTRAVNTALKSINILHKNEVI